MSPVKLQLNKRTFLAAILKKPGLIRNFIKAKDQNGSRFLYFKFLRISDARVTEGIFWAD
jgi:hypothetical protein